MLGPEVERFEGAFAGFCGARHAVGVGNGLDALRLTLQALGIGPGDEVIVPSHTYIATWLGGHRGGRDAGAGRAGGRRASRSTPTRRGGDRAAHGRRSCRCTCTVSRRRCRGLAELAARHGLALVADAAQAHGARLRGRPVGASATAAAWSFYPSKNLGALGDGGAVTTDDDALAARVRRLRNYGSERKYVNVGRARTAGSTSCRPRSCRSRLGHLDGVERPPDGDRRALRPRARGRDRRAAAGSPGADSCWHVYVVRSAARDALAEHLARGASGR